MTLMIDLAPDRQTALQQEADRRGVPAEAVVKELIEERFPAAPVNEDTEKRAELLAYLQGRLRNALTDPEQIGQAEADLNELHRSLNKNRIEAGERPLFPE